MRFHNTRHHRPRAGVHGVGLQRIHISGQHQDRGWRQLLGHPDHRLVLRVRKDRGEDVAHYQPGKGRPGVLRTPSGTYLFEVTVDNGTVTGTGSVSLEVISTTERVKPQVTISTAVDVTGVNWTVTFNATLQ